MVKSKSSDKGNGKGFFSRVAPDKVAAAIAYVGDRTDQLKSETWRLNMKTKMPGSLWGEIINELKLQHDEKTRHALYDLWHSNREDIQKLVEKQKRFDRGQEYDTDIEHTSGKEENSGFEGKVSLVAEPSLPLPAPPNTRMNEHKNVNHNESHNPAIARSARHISGSQRFLLGKRANDIGPLALYRELVDNADRALLEVGNETQCPTTETLKKAAADYRNKMRIDENIFRACRIIRQVYIKEDNKSEHIRGYIHDVSEVPFRVHLYTELQIRRYINYVKSETYSCVHIDATGGILKKMHEEKQSLLYALIFKDGIDAGDTVPLAHAILNDHTVPSKSTGINDERSKIPIEFDLNMYSHSSISNSSSSVNDDVKVTNDQPSKSLHSQQQYQPESLIGTRILRWPKFGVYDATYEGQLYSLTLTCPIDTALFCLYFVYETDINVAEELKKASESSSYATLIKTFDLVKTEGWDSARIFWLRAFNILKKYDKQPKSLFSSVDETVFKFLRTQQRHITKITCSRSDCAQRERDCSSTEIDMFCSDEQIEKFAIEAIGTCQAMIKRYDEITKIEALQKKYKEGRVYTFNIETNKHEYVQGWMCDSVNVQSKATFVYGHPPIVILNIKPFSKRHEEGYEATTVRLRDIKRTIRIGSIKYQLRAVINHKDDHFTTTLIELDGSLYIFDDLQGVRDTRTSTDRVEMAIYTKIYTF
ncbi:unnamed protein product [Rotaria sp. Silwood1]|nr:unnamed protein product [Rotaria sp. Silwood1]CAF3823079.1 unnamed protein product [Rotaria sp. Silwood1]CAF3847904.1 unnamed protein product [Rotaria sp. Silwood1]CAF4861392.1 unnamed protein product [Rotaria sp. Silwood1]CAF4937802.1 unnamed protein product [Rotaria sp. Silwood1]